MKISYFQKPVSKDKKDPKPYRTVDVSEVVEWIRTGIIPGVKNFPDIINRLRTAHNDTVQYIIKTAELPYVTWAGEFAIRNNDRINFLASSGVLYLDIDPYKKKDGEKVLVNPRIVEEPEKVKQEIISQPWCLSCYHSSRGIGFVVLVRINDVERETIYRALVKWFREKLSIIIDENASAFSQPNFLSHDPEIYFNADAMILSSTGKSAVPSEVKDPTVEIAGAGSNGESAGASGYDPQITILPSGEYSFVVPEESKDWNKRKREWFRHAVQIAGRCRDNKIDLTNAYKEEWLYIAFSLKIFGEAGRPLFHIISQQYSDYNEKTTDQKFDNALTKSKFTTPNKLFKIAEDYGIAPAIGGKNNSEEKGLDENNRRRVEPGESKTNKPDLDDKDTLSTNRSLRQILSARQYLDDHYDIRHNVVENVIEVSPKGKNQFELFNENEIWYEFQLNKIPFSLQKIMSLVKTSYVKKFHPFKDYFESNAAKYNWKEGDEDHIGNLAGFVTCNDQKRWAMQLKKNIVRSITCTLEDSIYNKQCITLVSPQKDLGKSEFIRFLVPPTLISYYTEHIMIHDKDGRTALTNNFIINLEELEVLARFDQRLLKAFLATQKVKQRLPYDKQWTNTVRRASFYASTNDTEFLVDVSDVRWICFFIEKIDWSYRQKIDIDAVYAQAYALYKSGFDYSLSRYESIENEKSNKQFEIHTSERELVQQNFFPGSQEDRVEDNGHSVFMQATDILRDITLKVPSALKVTREGIGKAMKPLGYNRVKFADKENGTEDGRYGYWVRSRSAGPLQRDETGAIVHTGKLNGTAQTKLFPEKEPAPDDDLPF